MLTPPRFNPATLPAVLTRHIGVQFDPTKKRLGVGQHPHRGFETVTVAFQGGVEHQDSTGNNDVIGPGDVQWMTAGRGLQ